MTNKKIVHRPLDREIATLAESHGYQAEAVLEILVEVLKDACREGIWHCHLLFNVGCKT